MTSFKVCAITLTNQQFQQSTQHWKILKQPVVVPFIDIWDIFLLCKIWFLVDHSGPPKNSFKFLVSKFGRSETSADDADNYNNRHNLSLGWCKSWCVAWWRRPPSPKQQQISGPTGHGQPSRENKDNDVFSCLCFSFIFF